MNHAAVASPQAAGRTALLRRHRLRDGGSRRRQRLRLGLVRVVGGEIVERTHFLIRPPRRTFVFTYVHGITWERVANEPTFAELWPRIREQLDGADFAAAHNAPFDRSVLKACCERAGLPVPDLRFECSMRLARAAWDVRPTKLPDVCRHLGISLRHHDALSDAEACAQDRPRGAWETGVIHGHGR